MQQPSLPSYLSHHLDTEICLPEQDPTPLLLSVITTAHCFPIGTMPHVLSLAGHSIHQDTLSVPSHQAVLPQGCFSCLEELLPAHHTQGLFLDHSKHKQLQIHLFLWWKFSQDLPSQPQKITKNTVRQSEKRPNQANTQNLAHESDKQERVTKKELKSVRAVTTFCTNCIYGFCYSLGTKHRETIQLSLYTLHTCSFTKPCKPQGRALCVKDLHLLHLLPFPFTDCST